MTVLVQLPRQRLFTNAGDPSSGAKLYVYNAGGSTPRAVYTTSALSVERTQPIVADAYGNFAACWINPAGGDYKITINSSADALVYTEDNLKTPQSSIAASGVAIASLEDIASHTVLGRDTAGTGEVEEVAAADVLDWIGSTQGNVLYRGAANWAALAPGVSGQYLKSGGASANPVWATPLSVTGINPDPSFDLSTTDDVYWKITNVGTQTGALSSGGVVGGKFATTFVNSTYPGIDYVSPSAGTSYEDATALVPKFPLTPVVDQSVYEAVVRWRKTSSIVDSRMEVYIGTAPDTYTVGAFRGPASFWGTTANTYRSTVIYDNVVGPATGSPDFMLNATYLDAATVNEWQEWVVQFKLRNTGTKSTVLPYLYSHLCFVSDMSGSGTIEIDSFQIARVSSDIPYQSGYPVGYLGRPRSTQDGTYSFLATDNGKTIVHTSASAHTWTIQTQANATYQDGATIYLDAGASSGVVTIAPAGGVSLVLAGAGTTGNRSLAANGYAELVRTGSNAWKIRGEGVT